MDGFGGFGSLLQNNVWGDGVARQYSTFANNAQNAYGRSFQFGDTYTNGYGSWSGGIFTPGVFTGVDLGDAIAAVLEGLPGGSLTDVAEPVKVAVEAPDVDEEYFALAAKLGITSAKVTQARIEKFLQEQAMGLYDYDRVDAYMRKLASSKGPYSYWCWKPLAGNRSWFHTGRGANHGSINQKAYPHQVPYPVLLTVKSVLAAFPEATIFVTDYEVAKPDPFVGVTTEQMYEHDGTILIFEKFNEPSFR